MTGGEAGSVQQWLGLPWLFRGKWFCSARDDHCRQPVSQPDNPVERFAPSPGGESFALWVVLDAVDGGFRFEWIPAGSNSGTAVGLSQPSRIQEFRWFALEWGFQFGGKRETDHCNRAAPSVRALLKRIVKRLPLRL